MLPIWARDTVTILRAPYIEQRGTKVRDWSRATRRTIGGCSVQPVGTSTTWTDPRQALTVQANLFAPAGADIQEGDKVVFGGHSYAVNGAPLEMRSPTGAATHLFVQLVDWRQ